jgi:hypothetical protein
VIPLPVTYSIFTRYINGIDSHAARCPELGIRATATSSEEFAATFPSVTLASDSKAAGRRRSFCARMSGNDGPMKKPNGDPTRKALALRKWNC